MKRRATMLPVLVVALVLGAGPAWAQTTTTPPTTTVKPTATAVPEPIPLPAALTAEVMRYVGGDGDNVPEPGERLQVFLALRNMGDKPATDITGTLQIASGSLVGGRRALTVIDGSSSWPDIPAGGAAESSTPFVIQIADSAAREKECPGLPTPLPRGSSEPGAAGGSTGSGTASTSTVSPNETIAPDVTVSSSPSVIEPAPSATAEPPIFVEPTPSASIEPADLPVAFQAIVRVRASGETFNTGFGSGIACAVDVVPSTPLPNGAGTQGAEKTAADLVTRESAPGGGEVLTILVVLLAAAAVGVRYRLTP
ncbi:MAG: hypothetical protein ACXVQX_06555 [Actinomycetota bacterium]